ncbi:hypothetical protein [Bradyrhizobium sp. BWA-3-5]|uniref:hypothetical protein n=1 Tax=Bradyrhizobium sp. BWA-3-5 TaxID=3080013 RepID=UPI00293E78BB|nr:hypothetical protein [Bradyrhizobium sp. BWA-3-5]WOH63812.1 hypothetical protein RX331_24315 [Bradyrhizobium sp. BWA-3-5]
MVIAVIITERRRRTSLPVFATLTWRNTNSDRDVIDTYGKMPLMDRVILNDGLAEVIDLEFHAFEFFKMCEEIGFMKEAARRPGHPIHRRGSASGSPHRLCF